MSRHHSDSRTNHGNKYNPYSNNLRDDSNPYSNNPRDNSNPYSNNPRDNSNPYPNNPRDLRDHIVRPDPAQHLSRPYPPDAWHPPDAWQRDPRDYRAQPPPPPPVFGNALAPIDALQAESARQSRNQLECLEPRVEGCKKPVGDQRKDFPLADLLLSGRA